MKPVQSLSQLFTLIHPNLFPVIHQRHLRSWTIITWCTLDVPRTSCAGRRAVQSKKQADYVLDSAAKTNVLMTCVSPGANLTAKIRTTRRTNEIDVQCRRRVCWRRAIEKQPTVRARPGLLMVSQCGLRWGNACPRLQLQASHSMPDIPGDDRTVGSRVASAFMAL
jgi:hypothetical protein